MNKYFKEFLDYIKEKDPKYDLEKIEKALNFANDMHKDQKRDSGEPYITHPVNVAKIIAEFDLDTDTIVATLLHDVVEDCNCTYADIKKMFGETVAELVDGVTKLGRIAYSSREEQQVENLRKMFLAMAKDIRVILIKLSDRLHNMRTLNYRSPEKQRKTALETMEVYAPLAHRLGMQKIKQELEDLSILYLDPIGCKEIEDNLENRKGEKKEFLDNILGNITKRLEDEHINFKLTWRIKHLYSIYRKMYNQNKTIDEIYDLYAVRIIVDSVADCYTVLGNIHDMYKPIPGRFKDYISTPKPNMYQSLHTTVIGRMGIPFEVQIRTWEMHRIAEYGIAAHWKYKDGISGKDSLDNKLEWVMHLLEIQQNTADDEEFMRTLKIDLFADEVFVFTPKGDVINLPYGANVIDFAYAIHSGVGNNMIGAKVNGKIVGFDYQLSNGEIVEIKTTSSPNHGPSRAWLKMVKTNEARNKIRTWFKKEKHDENVERGKEDFDREIRRIGVHLEDDEREELLAPIYQKYQLPNMTELYASIGYGGVMLSKILPKVKELYQKANKDTEDIQRFQPKKRKSVGGVIVENIDNCLVKFARCCNPLPGDDIVGFITKGYGVSVHKKNCPNVKNLFESAENKGRFIPVSWDINVKNSFQTAITVVSERHLGLVATITTLIANMHVMLHGLNVREIRDGRMQINIIIDVNNRKHLESVMNKISSIPDVVSVERGTL